MRGDGRVFQRGRVWWIAYMGPADAGRAKEIRESSGSDSENVATKLLRTRMREVANHRDGLRSFSGPKAEKLTGHDLFDALAADYAQRGIKSLRHTLSHVKAVRLHFGDDRAMTITSARVRNYIAMRTDDGASSATINRETRQLGAAFKLAAKEGVTLRAPYIPFLPEGEARSGFFEPSQHAAMLEHLHEPLGAMARFAYISGWRRAEVRLLRWEHVDRSVREVRLPDTKNGEGRSFPLDIPELSLWDLFEGLWAARSFTNRNGQALSEFVFHDAGRPISDTHFSRLWNRARTAAGGIVAGRIFHDYRRTAVRNLIRAGVPQSVAMKITGHVSDSIFRRYNITSTEDRKQALQSLSIYLGGERGNLRVIRPDSDNSRTVAVGLDVESKS